jgi:hypothetical protein
MAGCLLALCGLLMPRLVIIVLAIFTEYMAMAYETTIWPVLGWFFMPFTTLAYCAAMVNNDHQVTGGWIVIMIIAVIMDLGSNGNATRSRRSDD